MFKGCEFSLFVHHHTMMPTYYLLSSISDAFLGKWASANEKKNLKNTKKSIIDFILLINVICFCLRKSKIVSDKSGLLQVDLLLPFIKCDAKNMANETKRQPCSGWSNEYSSEQVWPGAVAGLRTLLDRAEACWMHHIKTNFIRWMLYIK